MATKKTSKTRQAAKSPRLPAARRTSVKRTAAKKRQQPPAPVPRRAIFIDVENTSSEEALLEVLDALKIDRAAQPTELTAVGNWRTVGQQVARRLASLGAQLVHSAPARGVRDWSDLWIAVAAGCWLGQAAPGDVLEIVSNDRAFDAVGDAAAARGVVYRRPQHRRGIAAPVHPAEPKPSRRRHGGRHRSRGRAEQRPSATAPAAAPPASPSTAAPRARHLPVEPHGASRDQMIAVISRLTNGEPGRWVNVDVLEKALKAEGFSRPQGSPRLVTRLRTLKEVEVDAHGRVRFALAGHAHAPSHQEATKRRREIEGDSSE